MIIIPVYVNPFNNGIEFPPYTEEPASDSYVEYFVDMENYYFFESVEERDAFYTERGLTTAPEM